MRMKARRSNVPILIVLAVLISCLIGGVFDSRKIYLPLTTLILLTALFDLLWQPNKEKGIAWLAIATGFGWEMLLGLSRSGRLLPELYLTLQRFSFLFLALLIFGILLRFSAAFTSEKDKEQSFIGWLADWKVEIAILILTAVSLRTVLQSGYYWDDARNATAYLYERGDGVPLIKNVLAFMGEYIRLGRINVLSCYYYFLFYLPDVASYKLVILLLTLLNQLLLLRVVRFVSGSRSLAQLSMLLIPLLIQFRPYQDPVTSFYGLMQVILAEMILMVWFLIRYLREGRRRDQLLSLLLFFISLMTYEVVFPFILMIGLLIWVETRKLAKALRYGLPYALVCLVLLGAVLILRQAHPPEEIYEGVRFSLNVGAVLRTYLNQISAALPLSFALLGKSAPILWNVTLIDSVFAYRAGEMLRAADAADWMTAAWLAVLCFWVLRKIANGMDQVDYRTILTIGFSFWLIPAVTISLSARYQGQITPGLGYLPVYLELFGVAILFACLVHWLINKRIPACCRQRFIRFVSVLCGVVCLFNMQNNRRMIALLNDVFLWPRLAGETALQSGIVDFLPEDATIVSLNSREYLWEKDWDEPGLFGQYYSIWSGRNFMNGTLRAAGRQNNAQLAELAAAGKTYVFSYDGDVQRGWQNSGG